MLTLYGYRRGQLSFFKETDLDPSGHIRICACSHMYKTDKRKNLYLSVGPRASLSRWRCSLWSLGASRDQEQERSRVALGPWCGEGDSTLPTVAFFTVPPQRAAQHKSQY